MEYVVRLSGRKYVLRPLRASEVARVNEMLCNEYGPCYPYPLRAERLSSRGIYIVCVDEHGEIVAFAKAEPRASHGFYEVGGLIIDPRHRVAGLGSALVQHSVDEARRETKVVFAEPVCYRADHASQRLFLKRGFQHCAIELFKYPHIQLQHLGTQPETVTVCVLPSSDEPLDQGRVLFVPSDYARRLELLLGRPLKHEEASFADGYAMPKVVHHNAVNFEGYLGAVFCDVPANWPEALDVIEAARANGFCLSGLLPNFGRLPDGTPYDYVRLYRPPQDLRPDFSLVHVVPALQPFLATMRTELTHCYR